MYRIVEVPNTNVNINYSSTFIHIPSHYTSFIQWQPNNLSDSRHINDQWSPYGLIIRRRLKNMWCQITIWRPYDTCKIIWQPPYNYLWPSFTYTCNMILLSFSDSNASEKWSMWCNSLQTTALWRQSNFE